MWDQFFRVHWLILWQDDGPAGGGKSSGGNGGVLVLK